MGRDALSWREMLPQIREENEAWRKKHLPRLRLFQEQRENTKKNERKTIQGILAQIVWRAEMNKIPDNRAIVGLCKELKKYLTNGSKDGIIVV